MPNVKCQICFQRGKAKGGYAYCDDCRKVLANIAALNIGERTNPNYWPAWYVAERAARVEAHAERVAREDPEFRKKSACLQTT